jgi:hypothetical protein
VPIRPENQARYPKNWKSEVVPRIRARSGNRCECTGECGRQHGPDADGRCLRINGEIGYWDRPQDGHWIRLGLTEADLDMRAEVADLVDGYKVVEIVLTVGHLNHQPEDCDPANLKHWCQGCHNRYDAPMRRAGIKARARAQRASGDLFACTEVVPWS